jgi:hypothetical protein
MAFNFSPKIVTNGLVLHLDAASRKSYISGSTTWNDLSKSRNNGALVNGPTFNANNNGYIVNDGTNDYVEVTTKNTNLEFQPLQAHSAFCWVYNLTNTTAIILGNMNAQSPYQGWDFLTVTNLLYAQVISSYPGNAVSVGVNFDYTGNANKWVYIGYTYNGTAPPTSQAALDSIDIYVNGGLVTSGKIVETGATGFTTQTISYLSNQRFRIASRWLSGAANYPAALGIAQAKIYNRQLSAQEILQNYNATKGRYGV